MYAFAKVEAGRSFREAQNRDLRCAIWYWGEAWEWGPSVTEGMTAEHEARAHAAIQKALGFAGAHANAKEMAFIQAMGVRYTKRFDPVSQVEQDRKLTGDPMYLGLALVRFGRFDEIGTGGERPAGDISAGVWDFARGYGELRAGNAEAARRYLDRVLSAAESSKAVFKFHSAKTLLGTLGGILEGEIHRTTGNPSAAVAASTGSEAIC